MVLSYMVPISRASCFDAPDAICIGVAHQINGRQHKASLGDNPIAVLLCDVGIDQDWQDIAPLCHYEPVVTMLLFGGKP